MKTVEGELSRAPSHSQYEAEILRDVSSWVVAYASKVFAITVQCHIDPDDLLTSIITFYNADFEDDSLPISDPAAIGLPRPRRSSPIHGQISGMTNFSSFNGDVLLRYSFESTMSTIYGVNALCRSQ
jgi:hypothetical protein